LSPRPGVAEDGAVDDAVIAELGRLTDDFFRAVSFEEGGRPEYERIRDLFIERGLLIKNVGPAPDIASVAEFIAPRQKLVDSGELTAFRETEVKHSTEVFGNVAQRLSTYTKNGISSGEHFAGRGVISTQFVRTPEGWRMSSMAWDDERPGLAVPDRYL
jgi:hypothetical protein